MLMKKCKERGIPLIHCTFLVLTDATNAGMAGVTAVTANLFQQVKADTLSKQE